MRPDSPEPSLLLESPMAAKQEKPQAEQTASIRKGLLSEKAAAAAP
ncbi:hypothetical protein BN871_EE_00080 [Paenibacillus sp. P22]|nr:hypothetical protein BN871_EE_00080 [Paenibacillus sp. P22]